MKKIPRSPLATRCPRSTAALTGALVLLLLVSAWTKPPARAESTDKSATDKSATDKSATDKSATDTMTTDAARAAIVADPKQVGGEPDSIVQVANLVYAGIKSSQCFSDHFLIEAVKTSSISTSRRFHAVKLSSDDIYGFPMLIMTGEGKFTLPEVERENLRRFVERGGFLLASAGCSSTEWDRSFRREIATIFAKTPLAPLTTDHSVFHTVHDMREELSAKHGKSRRLEGVSFSGRLGVLYSQDGLNDTAHTEGCCCCGGNEIVNAAKMNVNILAYALTH